jgi:hypothetical protein
MTIYTYRPLRKPRLPPLSYRRGSLAGSSSCRSPSRTCRMKSLGGKYSTCCPHCQRRSGSVTRTLSTGCTCEFPALPRSARISHAKADDSAAYRAARRSSRRRVSCWVCQPSLSLAHLLNSRRSFETMRNHHALSLLCVVFATAALLDPARHPYSIEAQEYYYLGRAALNLASPVRETTLAAIQALVSFTLLGVAHAHACLDSHGAISRSKRLGGDSLERCVDIHWHRRAVSAWGWC